MENTRLVTALVKAARLPRFALGAAVVDPWDEPGAVTAVYANLGAAQDAGAVDKEWLAGLEKRPLTRPTGHWYGVLCESGGAVLVGELDLRAATKKKATKKKATKKKAAKKASSSKPTRLQKGKASARPKKRG